MNNKIIIVIVFFIFTFFISCSSFNLFKQDNQTQYIASISPDSQNGTKIVLSLSTFANSSGQKLNFNEQFYGKYVILTPQIQMGGISLDAEMPASGRTSITKQNKLHLIFFIPGEKEEFLIEIQNNKLEIEEIESAGLIEFYTDAINLIPENTLSIAFYKEQFLPQKLKEMLLSNNAVPLHLPTGDYVKFKIDSYSEKDKYAHIQIDERHNRINKVYYFFNIKNSYALIDSILVSNNQEFRELGGTYSYNFDKKLMIDAEKNGGFVFTQITLPDFSNVNRSFNDISFSCNKMDSIKITITDKNNEIVKHHHYISNITGKITYQWDGIMDNGEAAPKGLYFYNVLVEKNKPIRKKFIW